MSIEAESVEVAATEPGFVLVRHVQRTRSGVDMGGRLWFERPNLPWVIETLTACLGPAAFARVEEQHGDDRFRVFEGGHERAPFVHLMNRRPEGAEHAGLYALNLTRPGASSLIQELTLLRSERTP